MLEATLTKNEDGTFTVVAGNINEVFSTYGRAAWTIEQYFKDPTGFQEKHATGDNKAIG